MLQTLLKDEQRKRSMSSRELASAIGTSHTTVLRALKGELVDLETIIKIANWLDVRPSSLLNGFGKKDRTMAQVASLVQRIPALATILEKATKAAEDGAVSPELVNDIVEYAAYKLSQAGGKRAK